MHRRRFLKLAGSGLFVPPAFGIVGTVSDPAFVGRQRAAASSSASPTDYAGLQGWWKADSLSLSDGDSVSSWADSSGSGYNGSSSGVYMPVYKTGIYNGKPTVRFDGSNDYFTISSFTISGTASANGYALLFVGKVNASVSDIFNQPSSNNQLYRAANYYGFYANPPASHYISATDFDALPSSLECMAVTYPGSGGGTNHTWYKNNVSNLTTGAFNSVTYTKIGNNDYNPFSGDFCELIVYNQARSSTELGTLYTSYLKPKWGLP